MDYNILTEKTLGFIETFGPKLLSALTIFIIGLIVAKITKALLTKKIAKKLSDPTLTIFVANISYVLILVLTLISALSKLGVPMTSFTAIVAASALAIGLSLQKSITNITSGILILLFRPYKIGDAICVNGISGTVLDINLLHTHFLQFDQFNVMMPNDKIISGNLINYSKSGFKLIEIKSTPLKDLSFDAAKEKIAPLLENPLIETKPQAPQIDFNASNKEVILRFWMKKAAAKTFKKDFSTDLEKALGKTQKAKK